ncbi:hypothetical protein BABINDRAFT_163674 [Babjeviella inositovora NRRL Y-12698]|uniref:RNA helicase n=1 Tax=Babjeviella inositovora NRRL Y-12698 TaxID=984486 RepID=A0A1E3QJB0_9ASCO|nr:uncharacterized protein BABINDRAFT_163674 [Babjeviella inositovora NRRL Y-12698]ODQ77162.1 hypothetical protein BABINDRAFT_163674 [Babjeviella inositovora NRRL Y-12698]
MSPAEGVTADEKKRLRREKLAAWKKKKEAEAAKLPETVTNAPAFHGIKKLTLKRVSAKSVFGDAADEADQPARKMKLLSFKDEENDEMNGGGHSNGDAKDGDDIDPFDAFMSTIADSSTASGQILESDEEIETEAVAGETPEELLAKLQQRKKKELPRVDHSKMAYEPFRRQFYTEPASTDFEVDPTLLGIKIRGVGCPRPIQHWSQLGLPLQMTHIIEQAGYTAPTPIQAQSLPAIMAGRDVIGVAKTGSGKTVAFLLPMFRHIADQRPLAKNEGPIALIMTPTRELATQIFRECRPYLRALNLRGVCAYGGSPIQEQIADLRRGAEVVICTPGRMIDLLAANGGRVTNVHRVSYLVLDEADRMFDMGFEPQITRIIQNVRPDRQTILFSATFPPKMEALARRILRKPVEIIVGERSVVGSDIAQEVEVVAQQTDKFVRLLSRIGKFFSDDSQGKVLVFVDRQDAADGLFHALMKRGYPSVTIHGGREQIDRDAAIQDFKNGVYNIMIATSVAARGLDVKQLRLVVNYDAPNHMEDYVHRVGRTGRAGMKGTALTLLTEDQERNATDIAKVMRLSGVEVPAAVRAMSDRFLEKFKSGKEQYGSGFGGKGLEKLEKLRNESRTVERRAYGEDDKEEKTPVVEAEVQTFDIVFGKAPLTSGLLTSAFDARICINDLPQKARWVVSQSYKKVSEEASVSITVRGRFYAENQTPKPGEEPKLYVLIEGETERSVEKAVALLKEAMIEGINMAATEEARAPATRYKV